MAVSSSRPPTVPARWEASQGLVLLLTVVVTVMVCLAFDDDRCDAETCVDRPNTDGKWYCTKARRAGMHAHIMAVLPSMRLTRCRFQYALLVMGLGWV